MKQLFSMTLSALALCASATLSAQTFEQGRQIEQMASILTPQERVAPFNKNLTERLDTLLPELMRETGIDMWVVINREYVEDALFFSLVPQPTFAARRTTMLVFSDQGEDKGVERFTVSRYPIRGFYESKWEGGSAESQWQRLAEIIQQRNPKKIGINTSKNWPLADGLTAGLRKQLEDNLDPKYRDRLVSAESLVVRWLETRTDSELELYPHVVSLARRVIGEAFSDKVITPGVTTSDQVAWYIRERFESLGLAPWFQPYVNIQRRGDKVSKDSSFYGKGGVIQRGDVLHTDVGICYLGLCTDTQEMGYVLRAGEADAPEGLKDALATGNRWQDLLTREFKTGRSGNEILAKTIKASTKAKILSTTYTHPIGITGHAVGPTIGMWDNQGPTPVRGDWKLSANTGYAIEGNIRTQVPEWNNQWVQIKLEQTAYFDGEQVIYAAGRQTRWHLVK